MKKITAFLLALVLILTCVATVACNTVVLVYLENYDGHNKTFTIVYDPYEDLPIPECEGYEFGGWYTDKELTQPFEKGTDMKHNFHLYAKWIETGKPHEHDFGDSYFMYVQCSVEGCNVLGRSQASQKYFSIADYVLDAYIEEIDTHYNELVAYINSGSDNTQFETLYDQYYEDVDFVVAQGDLAYLLSDVYSSFAKYDEAEEYYDTTIARYYGLFELIYQSSFKDYFYDGWSEDEIQEARDYAAMYTGSEEDQSDLRTIMSEYNTLLDEFDAYLNRHDELTSAHYTSINELYGRLVAANNAIATSAGYSSSDNKNYMDYAYENVYNREYSPSEVASMRNYVKTVIAPIFNSVAQQFYNFYSDYYYGMYFSNKANSNYYEGLTSLNVVDTVTASNHNFNTVSNTVNYIGDYYKYLSEVNNINFFDEANKLYKNGNYFTGTGTGAYTGYFVDTPAVYFQTKDYSNAFTFVHEFGHYYDFVVNSNLSASMDHAETQSQGDEMLFLAWLSNNKPSGITNGFTAVELNQLFDFLSTVILATAVDEFEQAAYSGTYNGATITDYNQTFVDILTSYGGANQYLNTDYWFYVVFDNAAYYISYAMSALPAIELYAKAGNSGLNAARESYLKLFTYSSNSSLVSNGNITASYEQILNYCGLHSAFQSELYTTIQSYFNSRS